MSVPSSEQKPPTPVDDTDYEHRRRVNLIAGATIVVLVAIGLWAVYIFNQHEQLDRCISSGRRNCTDLDIPQQNRGVLVPVQ